MKKLFKIIMILVFGMVSLCFTNCEARQDVFACKSKDGVTMYVDIDSINGFKNEFGVHVFGEGDPEPYYCVFYTQGGQTMYGITYKDSQAINLLSRSKNMQAVYRICMHYGGFWNE